MTPGATVNGQSGLAFLPRVRYIVEVALTLPYGVSWSPLNDAPASVLDHANEAARDLRAQGFRVRVRPIVLYA